MDDPELERRLLALEESADALRADRWAGGPALRGELPRVPSVAALPAASVGYAYRMVALVGTPDIVYVCLRNAGGTWDWRTAATG